MHDYFIGNIFVTFWERVFQQAIGIPIGNNCSSFLSTCICINMRLTSYNFLKKKQWTKLLNVIYAFLYFFVKYLFVYIVIKILVLVNPVIMLLLKIFSYSGRSFLLMCMPLCLLCYFDTYSVAMYLYIPLLCYCKR